MPTVFAFCRWAYAASLAVAVLGTLAWAEEKKPAGADPEQGVYESLRDVINRGADLYNSGRPAACASVYREALLGLEPQLADRPGLWDSVKVWVRETDRDPSDSHRAFILRAIIDNVRNQVNPSGSSSAVVRAVPKPEVKPEPKKKGDTIWDRAGGEPTFLKVVDDFLNPALKDPAVDFDRNHKYLQRKEDVDRLKRSMLTLASSITGGPYQWTGPSMKEVHKGMGIAGAQFDALKEHLRVALEKHLTNADDRKTILLAFEATRPSVEGAATIWERAGGAETFNKVIDDFVEAVLKDDAVDFTRGGRYPIAKDKDKKAKLKAGLLQLASTVTGGTLPAADMRSMKEVHKGMGITDAEFDAAAGHLKEALKKHLTNQEDIAAILDRLEGSRRSIVEK
jgi:hemoglobin